MIPPIKAEVAAYLAGDAALFGAIGQNIYPVVIPQRKKAATERFVIYQQVTAPRPHDLRNPGELIESRWQFDCYARTYSGAEEVSILLDDALARMRSVGLPTVRLAKVERDGGPSDLSTIRGDEQHHRVNFDFIIWYYEE